jgi:hypothetical protein
MKNLFEFVSDGLYNNEILTETCNLIIDETINESFQASLLTNLAKAIKDIESKNREKDAAETKRWHEQGYRGTPSKSAKSFASIFGPLTDTPRFGGKKTGIRGLKWSEIKDSDFKQYKGDDKEFVKFLKSVYAKKAIADMIVCAPGTKDIVAFIKGYAKTLGDVRVYYFESEGWKTGVQEKTAKKYKYDVRSLKVNETLELIKDFDIYVLEITESMIKDYDELHKDREESQKGSIEMDEDSMRALLKQQKARYNAMVKEIKAKKLQDDPNILFNDIKKANDDVVALFQKVMSKPENMDMRFDLSDLMRYVSYAYEEFYKSMKSQRDSDRHKERAKQRAKERGEEFNDDDYGKYDFDKSNAKEQIRDSKEYLEKVKKMIKEIEDQLK